MILRTRLNLSTNLLDTYIEPWEAEITPRKFSKMVEFDVIHHFSWLGVGEHVYVAGWFTTLNPMPQVEDKLPDASSSGTNSHHIEHHYGQLKNPENIIRKPPADHMPFFVTTKFQRRTANQARYAALVYGIAFVVVGIIAPALIVAMFSK